MILNFITFRKKILISVYLTNWNILYHFLVTCVACQLGYHFPILIRLDKPISSYIMKQNKSPQVLLHVSVFCDLKYCILTLDRAVNRRFLRTGLTCGNKRKKSRSWSEIMSIMKLYMQMASGVYQSVLVLSQGQLATRSSRQWTMGVGGQVASWWGPVDYVSREDITQNGPQLGTPQPRRRRSLEWGLEDNTMCCS